MDLIHWLLCLLLACGVLATDDLIFDLEGVSDDLISEGSTPECPLDDCHDVKSTSPGGDSLISPKLTIRTTPAPPSTTPKATPPTDTEGSGSECDDEEDCGSGSGQEPSPSTTDDIYITSPDTRPKTSRPTIRYAGSNHTATDSVVITVNMTEATTRRSLPASRQPPSGHRVTPAVTDTRSPVKPNPNRTSITLWIIIGIAGGVLLALLVLAYAVYKYKSKDEGTYKIDESKNYDAYEERKPMTQSTNGCDKSSSGPLIGKPVKKKSVKEWYV